MTGFLGSRCAEQLAACEGAFVTGIGRKLGRVDDLRKEHGIELTKVDLANNPPALKRAVKEQDIVIHTAAVMGGDPETAKKINTEATERLVRLAGETGARRFVHVSTVGAYDMTNHSTVDESVPLAVDHPAPYPRTKARAEKRAFEAAAATGLELAVVRPTMIYGPRHGVWTSRMYENVTEGKPVFLGDGSAHFHPVYHDDVVEAILRCATRSEAAGEAFNVSAGTTTWRAFMARVHGALRCSQRQRAEGTSPLDCTAP